MALIPNPTPPTPAQQTATQLYQMVNQVATLNRQQYKNAWMLLWKNPKGLTPQQAFATLGTDAAAFVAMSVQMATLLQAAATASGNAAAWLSGVTLGPPSGWTVAANQDGTVTVTQSTSGQ